MLLASAPSNASPVWPAAGVALAGGLLYGTKILPGIFMGALAAQIYSFLDASTLDSIGVSVFVGLVAAFGSCLQASLGVILINRYVGGDDPLIEDHKILRFLLLGGPVSCSVSATIGIAMLYFRHIIVTEDLWISWGTWWVGDTIGVLIFTPLILTFYAKPRDIWQPRQRYIAYPLAILFITVVSVFEYSKRLENARIATEFQRQVTRLHGVLQNEVEELVEINQVLQGMVDSSDGIEEAEFHQFTTPIIARHNTLQAMEWIPRIDDAKRTQLEQQSFKVRESDKKNTMVVAGRRDEYFPIYFVVPFRNNERAWGFDINSNPVVHQLIFRVIDTGKTLATQGIQLIQDQEKQYGIVLYSPVYRRNAVLDTVEQKREAFKGFVATVFRVHAFVRQVFAQAQETDLTLTIQDGGQLLFSSQETGYQHKLNFNELEQNLTINLAGREWQLSYQPSQRFYAGQKSWATWWLLFGGVFLTSLTGLGLMLLTGRAARVEELVKIKTLDLENSNRHLYQEMAKRHRLQIEQIGRNNVLEQLARGESLIDVLRTIALDVQKNHPEMLCSIQLLDADKKRLYNGASPNLPEFFIRAIDGIVVDQDSTTCSAAAAYRRTTEIVEDVLSHPCCQHFKKLFEQAELRSCWAEPIISSKNAVLGAFNIYYKTRRSPDSEDLLFIKRLAQLSAIAIERKNSESELRIAATTFQSHEAIVVTDSDGIILRVNQAFSKITGYSEAEAVGQNPRILSSGHHDEFFYQEMFAALAKEGRWQGEIWNRRKNGDIYPEWLMVTAVKNEQDEVSHYVAIFSDITEQKAAEKEIHDLAFFDPLTGLPNRRLLLDRLKQEIALATRNRFFGALFFLDLDHFKRLNDSLGHQVGDELLVQVAQRMKTLLRQEDTASRLGGDEFIVLISAQAKNLKQAADHAVDLAERIREIINQPFLLQGSLHHFSTSIGISIYPDSTAQPEAVIQQADTAMYRAKESGRNSISFFRPSMQEQADQRLILEKELRHAIQRQDFVLFYQPQVNRHGRVISAEALIRWQHPQKGIISPVEFIPIAEDTQLILPIGEWVLKEACRQIKHWERQGQVIDHIAVNVSSRQFRQSNFIQQVSEAVEEAGISAKRLMIELTEGSVIDNIDDTIDKMHALKKMGIEVSIDDFGTGYSSLSYLKQLPLSQLKIDKSFVRDIVSDPNDAVIVETIINMAKNLGLDVIAEGVETQAQMDFLIANGCVTFQGYFFGMPVIADEIEFLGREPAQTV